MSTARAARRGHGRTFHAGLRFVAAFAALAVIAVTVPSTKPDLQALAVPAAEAATLRVVTPRVLELSWVSAEGGPFPAVGPAHVALTVDGRSEPALAVGVRRRTEWAALRTTERVIGTSFFVQLARPLRQDQTVTLTLPAGPVSGTATARLDASRASEVIHVNQVGYLPRLTKRAFVGLSLGTLGELSLDGIDEFAVEGLDGVEHLRGPLTRRPDVGMPGQPPAYQGVRMADFSALQQPGVYRLRVPGLGTSQPFRIGEEAAALYARTYALGLLHQRCGTAVGLPATRFTHEACHIAPADIPEPGRAPSVDARLNAWTAAAANNPRHTAARMNSLAAALYPNQRRGSTSVIGGHHDAGDYGKYTVNSAHFVHTLVFAADALPGVRALDNLGLPESGDGVGDVLEFASWEVAFLLRMQDSDGGFFYLVQPRGRTYEDNVLPDQGDPQVVFPKNTAATAAAVAALAQAGSSPAFRAVFPAEAARCLDASERGWQFLQRAWSRFGRAGAYQMVRNYGDVFEDRDEIVWAATERFLATGDASAHALVLAEFDPLSVETLRWGWVGLFEAYGNAIRSYAFASETGRGLGRPLSELHRSRTREAVRRWGQTLAQASGDSAYGTSYPNASKRILSAGWYFSENNVFDLLVADLLGDGARLADAVADNLAFLSGANPSNLAFVTGIGDHVPREPVSQYAVNDRRVLPPSGTPVGNIQQIMPLLVSHGPLLRQASIPSDDGLVAPYPIYDRWADVWNTMGEATILDQARALAASAALLAGSPFARQPYTSVEARVSGLPDEAAVGQRLTLTAALGRGAPDANGATVLWEWGAAPVRGAEVNLSFDTRGEHWVEAELRWPDGRRAFAASTIRVR